MAAQAAYYQEGRSLDYTPVAAITGGDVIQLADGRAAVVPVDVAAAGQGAARVAGIFKLLKTASIALLKGGRVFWDVSAGKAHFRPESGTPDFYAGLVVEDAAGADTYVYVALNEQPNYTIDLSKGLWTTEATLGLGVTFTHPGVASLAFDAVAEAAQAALISQHGVPASAKPILEARMAVYDIGNNTAIDINVGLASGSHATDLSAITALATVHLAGNALDIFTQSDDSGTDRAPADTTINAVDDTYFELWIDARDDTDVKFYIDGVLVDTSAAKRILTAALTTTLYAIAHMEKTSDDTSAEVRVSRLTVRTSGE